MHSVSNHVTIQCHEDFSLRHLFIYTAQVDGIIKLTHCDFR